MVRLLANPMIMRAALVLVVAACAFMLAIFLMRALRQKFAAEGNLETSASARLEALPFHLYNTVIQQLKQQKHELQVQTQAEQRRTRTVENFSQAVLSNLSSGVLVFGLNGLVKQSNPAARQILGYNSPSGMSAEDIFRTARIYSSETSAAASVESENTLSDEVAAVLRHNSKHRKVEADYSTPMGKHLRIAVTVSPVPAADGSLLGAACLITDRSEFENLREQQRSQSELSAEMALELRTSLATISEYAQGLARTGGDNRAAQMAADIEAEAARLAKRMGGFLAPGASSPAGLAAAAAATEFGGKAQ
jgi:PAS domain-containing protein